MIILTGQMLKIEHFKHKKYKNTEKIKNFYKKMHFFSRNKYFSKCVCIYK